MRPDTIITVLAIIAFGLFLAFIGALQILSYWKCRYGIAVKHADEDQMTFFGKLAKSEETAKKASIEAESLREMNGKLMATYQNIGDLLIDRAEYVKELGDAIEQICALCTLHDFEDNATCEMCKWREARRSIVDPYVGGKGHVYPDTTNNFTPEQQEVSDKNCANCRKNPECPKTRTDGGFVEDANGECANWGSAEEYFREQERLLSEYQAGQRFRTCAYCKKRGYISTIDEEDDCFEEAEDGFCKNFVNEINPDDIKIGTVNRVVGDNIPKVDTPEEPVEETSTTTTDAPAEVPASDSGEDGAL